MNVTHAVLLNANPIQSNGFFSSPFRFLISTNVSPRPINPSGTFRKKIQCQEKYVVMKPPTGGPTTGATSPGQVMYAIASIKLCFSVVRSTTRRPTGTIIAPPMPCTMRAAVNSHIPLLSPHKHRRCSEDGNGRGEHGPRPHAIGHPSADGNKHGQHQ